MVLQRRVCLRISVVDCLLCAPAATEKGIVRGTFTPVVGVTIPYMVLGAAVPHSLYHHFVIINDFFDCYERHLSFFKPIVDACPGLQVRSNCDVAVERWL